MCYNSDGRNTGAYFSFFNFVDYQKNSFSKFIFHFLFSSDFFGEKILVVIKIPKTEIIVIINVEIT